MSDIVINSSEKEDGSSTFAVVFDAEGEGESVSKFITVNSWQSGRASISETAYRVDQPADKSVEGSAQASLEGDRLHLILNRAGLAQETDAFVILDSEDQATALYTEELGKTTAQAAPTFKTAQGQGYDATNMIQLATLTVPRGEKELGGPVTLGTA